MIRIALVGDAKAKKRNFLEQIAGGRENLRFFGDVAFYWNSIRIDDANFSAVQIWDIPMGQISSMSIQECDAVLMVYDGSDRQSFENALTKFKVMRMQSTLENCILLEFNDEILLKLNDKELLELNDQDLLELNDEELPEFNDQSSKKNFQAEGAQFAAFNGLKFAHLNLNFADDLWNFVNGLVKKLMMEKRSCNQKTMQPKKRIFFPKFKNQDGKFL